MCAMRLLQQQFFLGLVILFSFGCEQIQAQSIDFPNKQKRHVLRPRPKLEARQRIETIFSLSETLIFGFFARRCTTKSPLPPAAQKRFETPNCSRKVLLKSCCGLKYILQKYKGFPQLVNHLPLQLNAFSLLFELHFFGMLLGPR